MLARIASLVLGCLTCLLAQVFLAGVSNAEQSTADDLQWSVIARLAPESLLLDGAVVEDRIVVVGERGHVLLSEDSGASWQQIRVPTRATLTGVFFVDAEHGWAVGHDAVIIKTVDGGQNWTRVNFAPDEERPLLDVWFASRDKGIAIGAYGNFLETADGGETWEERVFEAADPNAEQASETETEETAITSIAQMSDFLDDEDPVSDLHLNEIRQADDGTLYIAAEAGHVFRSDDDGDTWQSLPSPYEGSFYGSLPLSGDELLLFGLRGQLFYSADRGLSWEQVDAGTDAILMGAIRLKDGRPLVLGLGGTILLGNNIAAESMPEFVLVQQDDRKAIATAIQNQAGDLILIGENGVNRLTADDLDPDAVGG